VNKLLLTPAEVSDALSIGRTKTYRLLTTGELPSIRIGGAIRVSVASLHAWIENSAVARTGKDGGDGFEPRPGGAR